MAPLGLWLLPLAVTWPASQSAHSLTAGEAPPLLPLLQLFARALADAPCEASRYGSSAVIYPFTETDDDVESVAAGVAQAKRDLPEATVLVTDVDNSGLGVPIGRSSGASRLLDILERINVRGVKRLPFRKQRSVNMLNEADNVVRRLHARIPRTHAARTLFASCAPSTSCPAAALRRMCRRSSSSRPPSTCHARCSPRSARSSDCASCPRRHACTCTPSRAAAPEGVGGVRRRRTRRAPSAERGLSSCRAS